MRVLVLSLDYPPSESSTGVLMSQLAGALTRRGHELTIITGCPAGREDIRAGWSDEGGVHVLRLTVTAFRSSTSTLARLAVFSLYNLLALVAGLFVRRPDLIFAPSPPFTNGIVSWLLGRLRRVPSVYCVQDFQTEAFVQFGVLKSPPIIRVFETAEQFACRANTRVVVLAAEWRDRLIARGLDPEQVVVVPNFVDINEIRPLPRDNAFTRRHGLDGKFIVMHAGSVAYRHGLETLLEAAGKLVDLKDVAFVVVGGGSKFGEFQRMAAEAQLQNVVILPWQPRSDLPFMRASADVHLILLRRGMTTHSVPCKVYEIMASGRPFLAAIDSPSEIARLASEEGCGLAVPPEDADAVASAVRQLRTDPTFAAFLGARGREVATARYSLDIAAGTYQSIFLSLVGAP